MKNILFVGLICAVLAGTMFAQKEKKWNEWSKKDAEKILNNSAWGQSLEKGEAAPDITSRNGSSNNQSQIRDQGQSRTPLPIYLRVRFVTAKPVREGIASMILQAEPNPSNELINQLQTIIDNGFGDFIVVGVNAEGKDPRAVGATLNALSRLKAAELTDKVYLERKDGTRLQLVDYKPPVADNMGGKFVFARSLDGAPFLTPESDSVRFVLNLSGNLKVNLKFSVSKMVYGEKLEY